jgi:predicted lipid-binding transport protein (Tim44 family)
MTQDHDQDRQALREHLLRTALRESEQARADAAQPDEGEDWPLLTALIGGLAVTLMVNTFIGLMPG